MEPGTAEEAAAPATDEATEASEPEPAARDETIEAPAEAEADEAPAAPDEAIEAADLVRRGQTVSLNLSGEETGKGTHDEAPKAGRVDDWTAEVSAAEAVEVPCSTCMYQPATGG